MVAVRKRALFVLLSGAVAVPGIALGWAPLAVDQDPLVRMPGTQPADGIALEGPRRCLNCHDDYDATVDPGFYWRGSMMAQAGRDPLFWAAVAVAAQDSIWAVGRPNATDLCLRCHSPGGWTAGRSDPTNGSSLTGDDFDGVTCDGCHRLYDPFFEDSFAGTRESSDWSNYWDEANATATPSLAAATVTRTADRLESTLVDYFDETPFFSPAHQPGPATYTENGSGQFFYAADPAKRGPFADDVARHDALYSRYTKSRYFCGTCHDVSNPVMHNLAQAAVRPGPGAPRLPSETDSPSSYFHVERTFSEFMVSGYALGAGLAGTGNFAPSVFATSRPGNLIATCQDCHMRDRSGAGCDKSGAPIRPGESAEHPRSGQPVHELTGANAFVPWLLASAVVGSPNYDAINASILRAGPAMLTMDLDAGLGLDAPALLAGVDRAIRNLHDAASIEGLSYSPSTGALSFRVVNHTGHKLISGYPEGRRMFLTVRVWSAGAISREINPYSSSVNTLKGLDLAYSPSSPPLAATEVYDERLVYEVLPSSSLTMEDHTFHFALADGRYKDNRIPPAGFRIAEAAAREVEPVWAGAASPAMFTAAEYAGGYDAVSLTVPPGAEGVEVGLYYQTTSREYVEFLRQEINGTGGTLAAPTPSGEPTAYIMAADPFFDQLRAWGDAMWTLWERNGTVPGAAPVEMAQAIWGTPGDPCAAVGSDGSACDDGDACTRTDLCLGGACVGSAPVICTASDACHVAGTCAPATGVCSDPDAPNGTSCGTLGSCAGGVCVEPPVDAGGADASAVDSGTVDSGTVDSGTVDSGTVDSGAVDGGMDAGDSAVADAAVDGDVPDGASADSAVDSAVTDGAQDSAIDAAFDSGTEPPLDSAVLEDGAVLPPPVDDGGCGCRVTGPATSANCVPIALVLLGWFFRRRRFRR